MSTRRPEARRRDGAAGAGEASPSRPVLRALRRRGFRVLQLADFVSVAAVLVLSNVLRPGIRGLTPGTYEPVEYAIAFGVVALLTVVVAYFGGAYEAEQRLGSRPQLPRLVGLAITAMLVVTLGQVMLFGGEDTRYYVPRFSLAILPLGASLLMAGNRRLARVLRQSRDGAPRVLLVGAPDDVNLARSHLKEAGTATVVGETTTGRDLLPVAEASGATDVLLLSSGLLDDVYPEPMTTLERRGVSMLQRVTAKETLLGLQGVREVGGMPFVALRTHTLPTSRARYKRAVELVSLLVSAPVTLLVTGAVAIFVLVVAGRPILFFQQRVGQDGVPFRMVKFRTMYPDAERRTGAVLATRADDRVIPACRWLRSTRLDELPQLWNVLRGEMSVVGPRPERPELTAQFEQLIPGYARRHEIPPGLTGLAQIHGRYHTDPEYKLGHDLQYLVNWSPVLDLQILLRTVWVVLARRV